MTKNAPSLQTWQVFHVARKVLGPKAVANVFGRRNARSAYDWAQDPAYTVQRVKRDPLESLHLMFTLLAERGREDVVRAAIKYLASTIEDLAPQNIEDLKPTLDAEVLADFRAVADLQDAIDDDLDEDEVKSFAQFAKEEIDRTVAKYLLEKNK